MKKEKQYISRNSILQRHSSFIKYFLSYFFILTTILVCFLLVINAQLRKTYNEHLTDKRNMHVNAIVERFNSNIINTTHIQSSLMTDMELKSSRHLTPGWYRYMAAQYISRYTVGNDFIDSICFYDEKYDFILSTGRYFKKTEIGFDIYNGTQFLSLDMNELANVSTSRLVYLPDSERGLLLFIPSRNSLSDRFFFYVISNKAIVDILKSGVANDISSLALMTPHKDVALGVNAQQLEESLMEIAPPFETINVIKNGILFVSPINQSELYLVAHGTNEAITQQVLSALFKTILVFLLIAVLGVLVILLAMRFTYWPLHHLIKKHLPKSDKNEGYINQLDFAFSKASSENEALHDKIEHYKDFMKKSILDTIVSGESTYVFNEDIDIDAFFTVEPDNQLFVIVMKGEKETTPELIKGFKELLSASLPEKSSCIVINIQNEQVTFIVQYPGIESDKEATLVLLMCDYHEQSKAYVAISDQSISPLEISLLYKHALAASAYWKNGKTVVAYAEIASDIVQDAIFEYPYQQLIEFTASLNSQSFEEAKGQLGGFFILLDKIVRDDSPFPDFYIRSVLIDILSGIINNMNRVQIKFQAYETLYFETLQLCRTHSYADKRDKFQKNMHELIDIYNLEYDSTTIYSDKIIYEIEKNYTSSDFSISNLASTFMVSTAYMSYLCKKELDTHFSTYLWQLRMDKAINLLQNTDMTIDAISEAVGYVNTSSFRRKFKQETNKTPSQIRREFQKNGKQKE